MSQDSDSQFKQLLLKDEYDEVKNLLKNASEFKKHYPKHNKWLDKALDEALLGKRLVYGLYKPMASSGSSALRIIGVAIVKITEETAELKSLYIREDCRNDKSNHFGRKLYEDTEKQLLTKGIHKIITDVPCENKETCLFLVQNGFQINGTVELYKKGDYNYILSKDVISYYTGDPFDWQNIIKWFLTNVYNFEITKIEDLGENSIIFTSLINNSKLGLESNIESMKSVCIVQNGFVGEGDVQSIIENVNKYSLPISSVFSHNFDLTAKANLNENRIICFDQKQVYSTSGCKIPKFEAKEINGLVVEVKQAYFEQMEQDSEFVFFKGPGIGRFAQKGNYIFFFVDANSDHSYGALTGFGKIKEITIDSPKVQWSKYGHRNSLFNKENYNQFTNYKENVLAIVVHDFKPINAIDYHILKKEFDNYFVEDKIGNMYVNNEFKTSFLDYVVSNSLIKIEQSDDLSLNSNRFDIQAKQNLIMDKLEEIHSDIRSSIEISSNIEKGILVLSSPGASDKLTLKVSTPLSGVLPIGLEKTTTFDLSNISYSDIFTDLDCKYNLGKDQLDKFNNWIKSIKWK